jgi:hypothetical protein
MNTTSETANGCKEENIQTGVISNDDCHNGELDTEFECKQEVHSEGEDEQKSVAKQITENLAGAAVKEENSDPKGTTEDERYVLLVEVQNIGSPIIQDFKTTVKTKTIKTW